MTAPVDWKRRAALVVAGVLFGAFLARYEGLRDRAVPDEAPSLGADTKAPIREASPGARPARVRERNDASPNRAAERLRLSDERARKEWEQALSAAFQEERDDDWADDVEQEIEDRVDAFQTQRPLSLLATSCFRRSCTLDVEWPEERGMEGALEELLVQLPGECTRRAVLFEGAEHTVGAKVLLTCPRLAQGATVEASFPR